MRQKDIKGHNEEKKTQSLNRSQNVEEIQNIKVNTLFQTISFGIDETSSSDKTWSTASTCCSASV